MAPPTAQEIGDSVRRARVAGSPAGAVGAGVAAGSTAATLAASTGASVALAAGIGAAIGASIPVPVVNLVIAAVAAATAALAVWLKGDLGKETFTPDPEDSLALLNLLRVDPALALTGLDRARNPGEAATVSRVLMLRSLTATDPTTGKYPASPEAVSLYLIGPNGKKGSTENIGHGDPREPLTDPAYFDAIWPAFKAKFDGGDYSKVIPSRITTAADAASVLSWLRAHPDATRRGIETLHSGNSQSLRDLVISVRRLAGEDGSQDPILGPMLGNVSFVPY